MSEMSFLAFEVNVLSRIEFDSMSIPIANRPDLGVAMKRRGKRVTTNSVLQSAWTRNMAAIQNNSERLSEADVNIVLEDAYVPGNKLLNASLRKWFNETDAWWFDNVRRSLDKLGSPHLFALAADLAMGVGDYVLSFDDTNRDLKQPLSVIFKRLWRNLPAPLNNSQNNSCQNRATYEFLAENFVELLFLRLPSKNSVVDSKTRWREEWLRGNDDFWNDFNASQTGKLGANVETRSQFLRSLEEALSIASNVKHWAIEYVDGGFISTQDVIDSINKIRHVDKIYSKDFSELLGVKASIITA